jgi:hypothetical protein
MNPPVYSTDKSIVIDFLKNLADYDKLGVLQDAGVKISLSNNEPILGDPPLIMDEEPISWEQFDNYFEVWMNNLKDDEIVVWINKLTCKEVN